MTEPALAAAIFLSYAREDTDAARRIAEALRAFGVEAWFDQNELRGGDTWDQKIRGQIRACALFLPIISARTQGRAEGYFRREWKLAVERTHDMAAGVAFIVPVVIDDTSEGEAAVPDEFMRVQWTRLAHGVPTPQFVEQIKHLLVAPRKAAAATRPAFPIAASVVASAPPTAAPRTSGFPKWIVAVVGLAMLAVSAFIALRPATKEPAAPPKISVEKNPATVAAVPTLPPLSEKSIAVLPFANLSADKENEFFTDGVHDDVITNLAKIRDLKVISRTSVMTYKTGERNLKKIAAELGVANVLEGSVRRVGSKVHMNAQLIDARTDEHLWADTFDGDASDIFALQASLAQKIAAALKATLTPGERSLIERRPTQNAEAYGLFLRAKSLDDLLTPRSGLAKYEQAATLYAQATARDPEFALAFARLTYVHAIMYWFGGMDPTPARRALAQAAMEATERLSPNAPETHIARGTMAYFCDNNWGRALGEYREAEQELPNDARLQSLIAFTHRRLGQWRDAVSHLEHALELNPADYNSGTQLALFLIDLRQFAAARDLARRLVPLAPADSFVLDLAVRAQFGLDGDRSAFIQAIAALPPADDDPTGLRAAYHLAMLMGDLTKADRALADPRCTGIDGLGGIIVEPAALHRAMIAWLQGRNEEAKRFADEAIAWQRGQKLAPRQQPYVALSIARAKAFAGRAAEAMPELQATVALALKLDGYGGRSAMLEAGRAYVALGRREEALALLQAMMHNPAGQSPNELRLDPLWSRLKDDPRFEEILKSAKSL